MSYDYEAARQAKADKAARIVAGLLPRTADDTLRWEPVPGGRGCCWVATLRDTTFRLNSNASTYSLHVSRDGETLATFGDYEADAVNDLKDEVYAQLARQRQRKQQQDNDTLDAIIRGLQ